MRSLFGRRIQSTSWSIVGRDVKPWVHVWKKSGSCGEGRPAKQGPVRILRYLSTHRGLCQKSQPTSGSCKALRQLPYSRPRAGASVHRPWPQECGLPEDLLRMPCTGVYGWPARSVSSCHRRCLTAGIPVQEDCIADACGRFASPSHHRIVSRGDTRNLAVPTNQRTFIDLARTDGRITARCFQRTFLLRTGIDFPILLPPFSME